MTPSNAQKRDYSSSSLVAGRFKVKRQRRRSVRLLSLPKRDRNSSAQNRKRSAEDDHAPLLTTTTASRKRRRYHTTTTSAKESLYAFFSQWSERLRRDTTGAATPDDNTNHHPVVDAGLPNRLPLPGRNPALDVVVTRYGLSRASIYRQYRSWRINNSNKKEDSDYGRMPDSPLSSDFLSSPSWEVPLAADCARVFDWDDAHSRAVCAGYRRFLEVIAAVSDRSDVAVELVPSPDVDRAWYVHARDRKRYEQDCERSFGKGRLVPRRRPDSVRTCPAECYRVTLVALAARFGTNEIDPAVWPKSPYGDDNDGRARDDNVTGDEQRSIVRIQTLSPSGMVVEPEPTRVSMCSQGSSSSTFFFPNDHDHQVGRKRVSSGERSLSHSKRSRRSARSGADDCVVFGIREGTSGGREYYFRARKVTRFVKVADAYRQRCGLPRDASLEFELFANDKTTISPDVRVGELNLRDGEVLITAKRIAAVV